jgi:hypothetical protein
MPKMKLEVSRGTPASVAPTYAVKRINATAASS